MSITWPNSNIARSVYYLQTGNFVGGSQVFSGGVPDNTFFVGDAINLTFFQFNNPSAPNAYVVYDYDGNQVVAAAISTSLQFVGSAGQWGIFNVAPPAGGFLPGSYRIILTGPQNDATYGFTYGTGSFTVIRNTPGFAGYNGVYPSGTVGGGGGGESRQVTLKGMMGMGTSRLQIGDATLVNTSNPTAGAPDSLATCRADATNIGLWKPADPARTWPVLCQFPNGTVDSVILGSTYINTYCKDGTIDGSKVFVATGPGSSSGSKVQVYYPNSSTLVETYDNIPATYPAAQTAINGVSNYIHVFQYTVNGIATTQAPTAIGNAHRAGVIAAVADLYTYGVTRFEGPSNEPGLSAELAYQMMMFTSYVHQGNPAAIATGPCAVDITNITGWKTYFDGCVAIGFTPQAISTHMYNSQINGDFNLGRFVLDRWYNLLASYGWDNLELWDTESVSNADLFSGYYFSHNTQFPMLQYLLREQYGFKRELNPPWYDGSHGFWSFPSFWVTGCGTLPFAPMTRALAEETFGMLHHHAIDFGSVNANHIFLGSVFMHVSNGTSVAVIQMHSSMPGATVTFQLLGSSLPSSMTVIDRFGNSSSVSVSGGQITMNVHASPDYLRIPAGVSVRAVGFNGNNTLGASISAAARGTFSGVSPSTQMTNGNYLTDWLSVTGYTHSNISAPDTVEVMFNSLISTSEVIATFVPIAQLPNGTLTGPPISFDVQTTADGGTTWTTRVSGLGTADINDRLTMADVQDTGSTYDRNQDFQWIHDINLGGTFSINGVRLVVQNVIQGGPIYLQEVSVISASTPTVFNSTSYQSLVEAESGLVAFWRFDDANVSSGATAASRVNSPAMDGTYGSFGTHTSVVGPLSDGVKAVQQTLDGRTLFQSPVTSSLGLGDTFSVEFWHNTNGNSANGGNFFGWVYAAGHILGINYLGGVISLDSVAHASVAYSDGNWHHVVVTKSGASTHIYIDGQDVTVLGTNNTYSGGYSGSSISFSTGTGSAVGIADLAIYSTVLSASAVENHYYASALLTAAPAVDATFVNPAPKAVGSPVVNNQLQSSQGHFTNVPNLYSYQWQSTSNSNGVTGATDIGGATHSDYIPSSADVGKYLSCVVTASNLNGSSPTSRSNILGPVTGLAETSSETIGAVLI